MANMLIDVVSIHGILTFMDGYSRYNQIFIIKPNVHKITFRRPDVLGVYKWIFMPFNLKNASVMYQRAMNAIFYDLIGKNMEVYIDM